MTTSSTLANTLRMFSVDATQKQRFSHQGFSVIMADIARLLWRDFLNQNPKNPSWAERGRFARSKGHGTVLIYSLLNFTGLLIEERKTSVKCTPKWLHRVRRNHRCPAGQGYTSTVGMTISEKTLAAKFNRPNHDIIDHFTCTFLDDDSMMEGISHEVCSLTSTLKLGKLVTLYDDNGISIDGPIEGWFTDDVSKLTAGM